MIMDADTAAIFISPHLDDAILSCGGYINHLSAQGVKVIVATIFTADYYGQASLSALAETNLRVWGLGGHPFIKRCEEDRLAARLVGAEIVHLGFNDCIYRQDEAGKFLYTQRVIDVPVHPLDWQTLEPALQNSLRDLLQRYASQQVTTFCPLGLGSHVDHILVRHAVEHVRVPRLVYYEEFPYALRSNDNGEQTRSMSSNAIAITNEDLQARLSASVCYASQIPGLFPSKWEILHQIMDARMPLSRRIYPIRYNVPACIDRMNTFIRKYSETIGGERYWTPDAQPIVLEGYER